MGQEAFIHDRQPLTEAFRRLLRDEDIKPVRLPVKSPNLNAFVERFVLSVKSGCLNRMAMFSERHLRLVLSEYAVH